MKTKTEYIRLLRQYMTENASKYGISRMGIFGSVARGENTERGGKSPWFLCVVWNKG